MPSLNLLHDRTFGGKPLQSLRVYNDPSLTALALTNRNDVLAVALGSPDTLCEPETDLRANHTFQLQGWPRVRLNDGRADPRRSPSMGWMRNNDHRMFSCPYR